jgi:hypothetical protein
MLRLIIILNILALIVFTEPFGPPKVEILDNPHNSNILISGNKANIENNNNNNNNNSPIHLKLNTEHPQDSIHINGPGTNGKGNYHIIINPNHNELLHELLLPKKKKNQQI